MGNQGNKERIIIAILAFLLVVSIAFIVKVQLLDDKCVDAKDVSQKDFKIESLTAQLRSDDFKNKTRGTIQSVAPESLVILNDENKILILKKHESTRVGTLTKDPVSNSMNYKFSTWDTIKKGDSVEILYNGLKEVVTLDIKSS